MSRRLSSNLGRRIDDFSFLQLEQEEQQRRIAEEKKAVVESDVVRVGMAREVNHLEDEEK